MANVYRIPLVAKAQQINILLAGVEYTIVCRWNEQCGWLLDISDAVTKTVLISCLPLVTGLNLVQQYAYTGIGGMLIAFTVGDSTAIPTYENLGIDSGVYFVVDNG
jgi:hypothetical protein